MEISVEKSKVEGFYELSLQANDTVVNYGIVSTQDLQEILLGLQLSVLKIIPILTEST